eukprot:Skav217601  [mRNA]  locus=scaffold3512:230842:232485:- [translate_table: standard]
MHKGDWSKRDDYGDDTCPLCGGEDDRAHFPMQCPALLDLRAEYANLLEATCSHHPHSIFLPVVYRHPQHDMLEVMNRHREMPTPFSLTEMGFSINWKPTFYTDGACAFPTLPGGFLSAYSVVFDSIPPGTQQAELACAFRNSHQLPPTLIPVLVAQPQGPQTINRAEFSAILMVIASVDEATIVTDSQWSIDTFSMVRQLPHAPSHVSRENFDLIQLLCQYAMSKDLSRFTLEKIRSHQEDDDVPGDWDLYHVLGNRLADNLAGRGINPNTSDFNKNVWGIANWYLDQVSTLQCLEPFLIRANQLRLDARELAINSAKQRMKPQVFDVNAMLAWAPAGRSCVSDQPTDDDILRGFMPGAGTFEALRKWASTLQWPESDTESSGISVYELACHFIGTTAHSMPRIVDRSTNPMQYQYLNSDPSAALLPYSVWDVVRIIEGAITFAKKFAHIDLVPSGIDKAQKPFLSLFGHKKVLAGYLVRPFLPHTVEHVRVMQLLVRDGILGMPIPFNIERSTAASHPLDALSYAERLKASRKLHNSLRKFRNNPG